MLLYDHMVLSVSYPFLIKNEYSLHVWLEFVVTIPTFLWNIKH